MNHKKNHLEVKTHSPRQGCSTNYSPMEDNLHGLRCKPGYISMKKENSRVNNSSKPHKDHHQTNEDYDPNKNIKLETIDSDYSSHAPTLNKTSNVNDLSHMKHKVSRWEQEEVALSIKEEPRARSNSRSRSPIVHRHQYHKSHRQSYDESKNDNRFPQEDGHQREDRKRENAYKKRSGKNPFVRSPTDSKNKTDQVKSEPEKAQPTMELSGKLTEHTNTYNGIIVKYNEPAEARKPKRRWRLYPFKGSEELPMLPIHRQSAYLIGRERLVADIPVGHPSCSKQHAVLQFRKVQFKRITGTVGFRVRPYIIDLNSSNGTYINCKKVKPQCYVELFEKDLIKFGYSSREYILLHEESNTLEVESGDRDEVSD